MARVVQDLLSYRDDILLYRDDILLYRDDILLYRDDILLYRDDILCIGMNRSETSVVSSQMKINPVTAFLIAHCA